MFDGNGETFAALTLVQDIRGALYIYPTQSTILNGVG